MPILNEARCQRFAFITEQAVKMLPIFSRCDQNKFLKALSNPIRFDRCKKMINRDGYWRLRITDDLRISFCWNDGQVCVVHLGKHKKSDLFIERGETPVSSEPRPIEEILVKKNHVEVCKTREGNNQPAAAQWHQQMIHGLKGLFDEMMVSELDEIRELSVDEIKEVRKQIDAQFESIAMVDGKVDSFSKSFRLALAEQENHARKLTNLGENLTVDAKHHTESVARALAASGRELGEKTVRLEKEVAQIANDITERFSTLTNANALLQTANGKIADEVLRLTEQLACANEKTAQLARRVAEMDSVAEQRCATVSVLSRRLDEAMDVVRDLTRANEVREVAIERRTWKSRLQRISQVFEGWISKGKVKA